MNRIVVHYSDGKVHKGFTGDFVPTKSLFHLISAKDPTKQLAIQVSALKAIFFVKDFQGNPHRMDKPGVDSSLRQRGKQLRITFKDGEVFYGMSEGYHPDAIGFFIIPGDLNCNIIRAFIVNAFVERTEILQ